MKILFLFALISIFWTNGKADLKDFIIENEHDLQRFGSEDELYEDDFDVPDDLDEYGCGYESPSQKYLNDDVYCDEEFNDQLEPNTAVDVFENVLKGQGINFNYIRQLFAQISSNPKYAKILEQMMMEEEFMNQPSCSNELGSDIFTAGPREDDLYY